MYTRILVPLDGSELSEGILPYVKMLARGFQCPVQLLRVAEPLPEVVEELAFGTYPDRPTESVQTLAEEYLAHKAGDLQRDGLAVETVVKEGNAADQILEAADESPETLIAMSTHGRSGITRWLMGSVANKVLHGATSPLLLVRSDGEEDSPPEQISRVIVPLDRSPTAEQVLPHVVALAQAMDLEVHLTWAFPMIEGHYTDIGYGGITYGVAEYGEVSREIEAEAQRYFASVQETLQGQGVTRVETHLLWGHPASCIVDLARDTPNSMVALVTHGRTGPGRWVLGSVADHVVREAREPVLLVRAS